MPSELMRASTRTGYYDKAVEVVTDEVRVETHKEDIRLVEQSKAWVLSPERKASQKEELML